MATTDILIYLSGVNDPGGQQLDDTTPDSSGFLMRKPMQEIAKKRGAAFLAVSGALEPDQMERGLKLILGFIVSQSSDPLGKLIIYGYSAGGNNSLELCRRIEQLDFFLAQKNSEPFIVDLLVTVDAARREDHSLGIRRGVAGCVTTNVNYFQTVPSPAPGSGAHGARNHAIPSLFDPSRRATVINNNVTGELGFFTLKTHHNQIEGATLDRCKAAINAALTPSP